MRNPLLVDSAAFDLGVYALVRPAAEEEGDAGVAAGLEAGGLEAGGLEASLFDDVLLRCGAASEARPAGAPQGSARLRIACAPGDG